MKYCHLILIICLFFSAALADETEVSSGILSSFSKLDFFHQFLIVITTISGPILLILLLRLIDYLTNRARDAGKSRARSKVRSKAGISSIPSGQPGSKENPIDVD